MLPRLVIIRGGERGAEYTLRPGRPITIGRAADARIALDARYVSHYHCSVVLGEGVCFVADMLSQNGTFVNHQRTDFAKLHHGDVIQVGQARLRFLWPGAAEAKTSAPDNSWDEPEAQAANHGKLVLTAGAGQEAEFCLPTDRVLTIGRAAHADLWLPIKSVSRIHCVLAHDGETFVLSDARSENGTLVNGKPIECAELHDGDVIQLGHAQLVFSGSAAQPEAEPEPLDADDEDTQDEIVVRPPAAPADERTEANAGEPKAPLPDIAAHETSPMIDFAAVRARAGLDAEKPSEAEAQEPLEQAARQQEQRYKLKPDNPEALRRDVVCTECHHRFVFAPYEGKRSLKCPRCDGLGVSLSFLQEWEAEQALKRRRRYMHIGAVAASALLCVGLGLVYGLRPSQCAIADVEMVVDAQGNPVGEDVAALGSTNPKARRRAIQHFVQQGSDAIRPLVTGLESNSRIVRLSAAYTLSKIGTEKSGDALMGHIQHRDPEVRYQIIDALEAMGDKRAAEPIMDRLQDRAPPVRAKAAEAIGTLGDERALPRLRRLISDRDTRTRRHAIRAMEKIMGQDLFVAKRGGKLIVRPRRASDPPPED